jgi:uncharacterized lipoprotein
MKKFMCIFLAVIMLLSMAACGGETAQPTEAAAESGSTAIYTVTVETAGGMMLPGLDVFIYADDLHRATRVGDLIGSKNPSDIQ